MLHEEVEINWDTIQNIIQDFSVFEKIRSELIVGVSKFFAEPFKRRKKSNLRGDSFLGKYYVYWKTFKNKKCPTTTNVCN